MTDIFKRVKTIFSTLKGFISPQGGELDPYDKLVERFKKPRPLEVSELDEIKDLCKSIAEEDGQELIDSRFDVLKDIMFEKVVDATCQSKVTVEDKKVKNKKEYKEFIEKEYKRMTCRNSDQDKKEVKRIKRNTLNFKNEVSWGILPDKWRHVRENAPLDVVEFALNNNDESKGPILFIGDVPSDQEEGYFTEEYINDLFKRSKKSDIICDLYNPETNCRKCIRYEYNQERIRIMKDEVDREKYKEEELLENIKERCGGKVDLSDKTMNPEDKIWLSFLFNKDFKFSNLSDKDKNLFFNKLKSSGVLCMDALVEGSVNDRTKDFAAKRDLFDFRENPTDILKGSVFESSHTKGEGQPESDRMNSEADVIPERSRVFNFQPIKTEEEISAGGEEDKQEDKEKGKSNINLPPPVFKMGESNGKANSSITLPPLILDSDNDKKNITPPVLKMGGSNDNSRITLPPPIFNLDKETVKANSENHTINSKRNLAEQAVGERTQEEESSFTPFSFNSTVIKEKDQSDVKVPDTWHFFPKYPVEIKKDSTINSETVNKPHPPVFTKQTNPSFINLPPLTSTPLDLNNEQKQTPSLNAFLPVNNPNNDLKATSGPFSFTPSNNFFPTTSSSLSNPPVSSNPPSFPPVALSSNSSSFPPLSTSPVGPLKRKRDIVNSNQNVINPPASSGQLFPQPMLQTPTISNNPEFNKVMEIKQNNSPFLGEVPNPFQTSNPLQHSRNDNLNFVDNTFKYKDLFNKDGQNLFMNSKSMFDDIIFDNNQNNDQESTVRYRNKKDDNSGGGLFGSNLFGNDNDPWNK